jgi:hypothetical protein
MKRLDFNKFINAAMTSLLHKQLIYRLSEVTLDQEPLCSFPLSH